MEQTTNELQIKTGISTNQKTLPKNMNYNTSLFYTNNTTVLI